MRTDEDVKKDIMQIKNLFNRLRVMKEREIVMTRLGKMINPGEIREMNELASNIEAIIRRNTSIVNFRTRKLFEAEKYNYEMTVKSWENRKKMALAALERNLKEKDKETK
ncbi:MAG: hypothetical protein D6734_11005 [Candidatus Schekmanbacteria bacterium]|nr:MAG: hypothetical protein D6734_11005 [Candidatus Schekmanbacteria bacterium]